MVAAVLAMVVEVLEMVAAVLAQVAEVLEMFEKLELLERPEMMLLLERLEKEMVLRVMVFHGTLEMVLVPRVVLDQTKCSSAPVFDQNNLNIYT